MKLLKPSWIHHDGHPIFCIDIHPDDTRFVTGGQGNDSVGRIVIWNMKPVLNLQNEQQENNSQQETTIDSTSGTILPKLFCQLDHHNACVNAVRWCHSGRFLASGGDDRIIIIWRLTAKANPNSISRNQTNCSFGKTNYETWKPVSTLRSHTGDILDLSWSPDDKYLASASVDNTVLIWDANKFPTVVAELRGHTSLVKGVTWDPVGKYIASQSDDKTLKIWRTSDWEQEHMVEDPFHECGGTTHVLRLDWSPDGMYLVSAHAMNGGGPTAQIVERDGWKTDKDFVGHRKAVVCVRFNPNIMTQSKTRTCCVALGSRDRSISVWSTHLKRPVVVVKDIFTNSVMDLSWSSCGTIMMACSWDGTVAVAQFTSTEIGKPLSSEEKISLHHRVYGKSMTTNSSPTIIQNIEVFLARKEKENETIIDDPDIIDINHHHHHTNNNNNNINKKSTLNNDFDVMETNESQIIVRGPTDKQIETRTPDGKRRITPKFLPNIDPSFLTTIPCTTTTTIFQNSEHSSNQSNLRENMVSGIEEMKLVGGNDEKKEGNGNGSGVVVGAPILMDTIDAPPIISDEQNKMLMTTTNIQQQQQQQQPTNTIENIKNNNIDGGCTTTSTTDRKEMNDNIILMDTGSCTLKMTEQQMNEIKSSKDPNDTINNNKMNNNNNIEQLELNNKKNNYNNIDLPPPILTPAIPLSSTTTTTTSSFGGPIPTTLKRKTSDDTKQNKIIKKNIKIPPTLVENIITDVTTYGSTPPRPIPSSSSSSTTNTIPSISRTHTISSSTTSPPRRRLNPMKINGLFTTRIQKKPDTSYTLEIDNQCRIGIKNHILKCQHEILPTSSTLASSSSSSSSSLNGLFWNIQTEAPICGISGDGFRIICVCEDATVHVLDLKGRYAFPPLIVSSVPSKLAHNGPYLLIVTTKATMHIWNIHTKKSIKTESIMQLINQPGGSGSGGGVGVGNYETNISGGSGTAGGNMTTTTTSTSASTSSKLIDISHISVTSNGIPRLILTNGKSFLYNMDMNCWMIMSDPNTRITSLHLDPLCKKTGIISQIKLRLATATELERTDDVRQWLIILAKSLATQGLRGELHQLCSDLLGPTHSSSIVKLGNWSSKIVGVDKRDVLKIILNTLLHDLTWQDFYCEFQDQLDQVKDQVEIIDKNLDPIVVLDPS